MAKLVARDGLKIHWSKRPCRFDPDQEYKTFGKHITIILKMLTMDEKIIIESCNTSLSMSEAAKKAGIPHMTFKRYAIKLGIYNPNTAGKGIYKSKKNLKDVFSGKVGMSSGQLRIRLIREGYKKNKCEKCGQESIWFENPLVMELNHIDGNKKNNKLENLEILCPNCHSQTFTFRGRNIPKKSRCGAVG